MQDKEFSLEVIVNGKPVYEYPHQGDTFIEGRKGSSFKLMFSNRSSGKVLVVPSVDGISTLDGNPAGPDSPGLVVPAYGKVEIPGWMVDSAKAAEFVFKDRDSSYARGIDATTTNTGVIGVMVFAEAVKQPQVIHTTTILPLYRDTYVRRYDPWMPSSPITWSNNTADSATYNMVGTSVSMGIADSNAKSTLSDSYDPMATMDAYFGTAQTEQPEQLGVGWGASTNFNTTATTFDKGEKKSQIVLYYDTRKNLERRGIIVERRDSLSVRPNPFPGVGCKPPAGWTG